MIERSSEFQLFAVAGFPEVGSGDDLASILMSAIESGPLSIADGDILVLAHKVVSKAEGRIVHLGDVEPSDEAQRLGGELNKDPRKVEVILRESSRVVRAHRHEGGKEGVLICEHRLGFVSANAGVDESNVSQSGAVILLPEDPDSSARKLRDTVRSCLSVGIGVVITDSFGRPWRLGIVNVAIGLAGVPSIVDYRGQKDSGGRILRSSTLAIADEIAAASGLVMGKIERCPAVLIKGLRLPAGDCSGRSLIRPEDKDLFR